jgi:RNase adapter protein RapZ
MAKTKKITGSDAQRFLIITGLSGSGMSSATNAFEDLGFFCVDNLPISLLSMFTRLLLPDGEEKVAIDRAALVIDIRERQFLSEFPRALADLRRQALNPYVIFFEASDEVLQRRFSETRRPHPFDQGRDLLTAIMSERKAMESVRSAADSIIDTSDHSVHALRRMLVEKFSPDAPDAPLRINVVSFGHKHGVPRQIDLLFDVRHLPNPFFVRELKDLPGTNRKIIAYLDGQDEVVETRRRFIELLDYLIPLYKREGKSYLTIGIGCTGGRHRSVKIAEDIGRAMKKRGAEVSILHRDVKK